MHPIRQLPCQGIIRLLAVACLPLGYSRLEHIEYVEDPQDSQLERPCTLDPARVDASSGFYVLKCVHLVTKVQVLLKGEYIYDAKGNPFPEEGVKVVLSQPNIGEIITANSCSGEIAAEDLGTCDKFKVDIFREAEDVKAELAALGVSYSGVSTLEPLFASTTFDYQTSVVIGKHFAISAGGKPGVYVGIECGDEDVDCGLPSDAACRRQVPHRNDMWPVRPMKAVGEYTYLICAINGMPQLIAEDQHVQRYKLTVRITPAYSNLLASISLGGHYNLNPAFSKDQQTYIVPLPVEVASIPVTVVAEDDEAALSLSYEGHKASHTPRGRAKVIVHMPDNHHLDWDETPRYTQPLTIQVTAADGSRFISYTVTFKALVSSFCNLQNITPAPDTDCTIRPPFHENITDYECIWWHEQEKDGKSIPKEHGGIAVHVDYKKCKDCKLTAPNPLRKKHKHLSLNYDEEGMYAWQSGKHWIRKFLYGEEHTISFQVLSADKFTRKIYRVKLKRDAEMWMQTWFTRLVSRIVTVLSTIMAVANMPNLIALAKQLQFMSLTNEIDGIPTIYSDFVDSMKNWNLEDFDFIPWAKWFHLPGKEDIVDLADKWMHSWEHSYNLTHSDIYIQYCFARSAKSATGDIIYANAFLQLHADASWELIESLRWNKHDRVQDQANRPKRHQAHQVHQRSHIKLKKEVRKNLETYHFDEKTFKAVLKYVRNQTGMTDQNLRTSWPLIACQFSPIKALVHALKVKWNLMQFKHTLQRTTGVFLVLGVVGLVLGFAYFIYFRMAMSGQQKRPRFLEPGPLLIFIGDYCFQPFANSVITVFFSDKAMHIWTYVIPQQFVQFCCCCGIIGYPIAFLSALMWRLKTLRDKSYLVWNPAFNSYTDARCQNINVILHPRKIPAWVPGLYQLCTSHVRACFPVLSEDGELLQFDAPPSKASEMSKQEDLKKSKDSEAYRKEMEESLEEEVAVWQNKRSKTAYDTNFSESLAGLSDMYKKFAKRSSEQGNHYVRQQSKLLESSIGQGREFPPWYTEDLDKEFPAWEADHSEQFKNRPLHELIEKWTRHSKEKNSDIIVKTKSNDETENLKKGRQEIEKLDEEETLAMIEWIQAHIRLEKKMLQYNIMRVEVIDNILKPCEPVKDDSRSTTPWLPTDSDEREDERGHEKELDEFVDGHEFLENDLGQRLMCNSSDGWRIFGYIHPLGWLIPGGSKGCRLSWESEPEGGWEAEQEVFKNGRCYADKWQWLYHDFDQEWREDEEVPFFGWKKKDVVLYPAIKAWLLRTWRTRVPLRVKTDEKNKMRRWIWKILAPRFLLKIKLGYMADEHPKFHAEKEILEIAKMDFDILWNDIQTRKPPADNLIGSEKYAVIHGELLSYTLMRVEDTYPFGVEEPWMKSVDMPEVKETKVMMDSRSFHLRGGSDELKNIHEQNPLVPKTGYYTSLEFMRQGDREVGVKRYTMLKPDGSWATVKVTVLMRHVLTVMEYLPGFKLNVDKECIDMPFKDQYSVVISKAKKDEHNNYFIERALRLCIVALLAWHLSGRGKAIGFLVITTFNWGYNLYVRRKNASTSEALQDTDVLRLSLQVITLVFILCGQLGMPGPICALLCILMVCITLAIMNARTMLKSMGKFISGLGDSVEQGWAALRDIKQRIKYTFIPKPKGQENFREVESITIILPELGLAFEGEPQLPRNFAEEEARHMTVSKKLAYYSMERDEYRKYASIQEHPRFEADILPGCFMMLEIDQAMHRKKFPQIVATIHCVNHTNSDSSSLSRPMYDSFLMLTKELPGGELWEPEFDKNKEKVEKLVAGWNSKVDAWMEELGAVDSDRTGTRQIKEDLDKNLRSECTSSLVRNMFKVHIEDVCVPRQGCFTCQDLKGKPAYVSVLYRGESLSETFPMNRVSDFAHFSEALLVTGKRRASTDSSTGDRESNAGSLQLRDSQEQSSFEEYYAIVQDVDGGDGWLRVNKNKYLPMKIGDDAVIHREAGPLALTSEIHNEFGIPIPVGVNNIIFAVWVQDTDSTEELVGFTDEVEVKKLISTDDELIWPHEIPAHHFDIHCTWDRDLYGKIKAQVDEEIAHTAENNVVDGAALPTRSRLSSYASILLPAVFSRESRKEKLGHFKGRISLKMRNYDNKEQETDVNDMKILEDMIKGVTTMNYAKLDRHTDEWLVFARVFGICPIEKDLKYLEDKLKQLDDIKKRQTSDSSLEKYVKQQLRRQLIKKEEMSNAIERLGKQLDEERKRLEKMRGKKICPLAELKKRSIGDHVVQDFSQSEQGLSLFQRVLGNMDRSRSDSRQTPVSENEKGSSTLSLTGTSSEPRGLSRHEPKEREDNWFANQLLNQLREYRDMRLKSSKQILHYVIMSNQIKQDHRWRPDEIPPHLCSILARHFEDVPEVTLVGLVGSTSSKGVKFTRMLIEGTNHPALLEGRLSFKAVINKELDTEERWTSSLNASDKQFFKAVINKELDTVKRIASSLEALDEHEEFTLYLYWDGVSRWVISPRPGKSVPKRLKPDIKKFMWAQENVVTPDRIVHTNWRYWNTAEKDWKINESLKVLGRARSGAKGPERDTSSMSFQPVKTTTGLSFLSEDDPAKENSLYNRFKGVFDDIVGTFCSSDDKAEVDPEMRDCMVSLNATRIRFTWKDDHIEKLAPFRRFLLVSYGNYNRAWKEMTKFKEVNRKLAIRNLVKMFQRSYDGLKAELDLADQDKKNTLARPARSEIPQKDSTVSSIKSTKSEGVMRGTKRQLTVMTSSSPFSRVRTSTTLTEASFKGDMSSTAGDSSDAESMYPQDLKKLYDYVKAGADHDADSKFEAKATAIMENLDKDSNQLVDLMELERLYNKEADEEIGGVIQHFREWIKLHPWYKDESRLWVELSAGDESDPGVFLNKEEFTYSMEMDMSNFLEEKKKEFKHRKELVSKDDGEGQVIINSALWGRGHLQLQCTVIGLSARKLLTGDSSWDLRVEGRETPFKVRQKPQPLEMPETEGHQKIKPIQECILDYDYEEDHRNKFVFFKYGGESSNFSLISFRPKNVPSPKEKAEVLFDELDINNSGRISLKEVVPSSGDQLEDVGRSLIPFDVPLSQIQEITTEEFKAYGVQKKLTIKLKVQKTFAERAEWSSLKRALDPGASTKSGDYEAVHFCMLEDYFKLWQQVIKDSGLQTKQTWVRHYNGVYQEHPHMKGVYMREGSGTQRWPNGQVYEGEWKGHACHGTGKLWASYDDWQASLPQTSAMASSLPPARVPEPIYDGTWWEGSRSKTGVLNWQQSLVLHTDRYAVIGETHLGIQRTYKGSFKDGLFHGFGTLQTKGVLSTPEASRVQDSSAGAHVVTFPMPDPSKIMKFTGEFDSNWSEVHKFMHKHSFEYRMQYFNIYTVAFISNNGLVSSEFFIDSEEAKKGFQKHENNRRPCLLMDPLGKKLNRFPESGQEDDLIQNMLDLWSLSSVACTPKFTALTKYDSLHKTARFLRHFGLEAGGAQRAGSPMPDPGLRLYQMRIDSTETHARDLCMSEAFAADAAAAAAADEKNAAAAAAEAFAAAASDGSSSVNRGVETSTSKAAAAAAAAAASDGSSFVTRGVRTSIGKVNLDLKPYQPKGIPGDTLHIRNGTAIYGNGDYSYYGSFKCGWPDGNGTLKLYETGVTDAVVAEYVGDFKMGERDGKGIYDLVGSLKYDGQWKANKRCGQGTQNIDEKRRHEFNYKFYHGEWQDDLPHGKGVMTMWGGDVYDGQFVKGRRHGHGVIKSKVRLPPEEQENPEQHHGFVDRLWHHGASSQQSQEANMSQDLKEEIVYNGLWKDDAIDATEEHPAWVFMLTEDQRTSHVYRGGLTPDGLRKGSGTLYKGCARRSEEVNKAFQSTSTPVSALTAETDKKYRIYEGQWDKNVPHGEGNQYFKEGNYEGQFNEGLRQGRGIWTSVPEKNGEEITQFVYRPVGDPLKTNWDADMMHGVAIVEDREIHENVIYTNGRCKMPFTVSGPPKTQFEDSRLVGALVRKVNEKRLDWEKQHQPDMHEKKLDVANETIKSKREASSGQSLELVERAPQGPGSAVAIFAGNAMLPASRLASGLHTLAIRQRRYDMGLPVMDVLVSGCTGTNEVMNGLYFQMANTHGLRIFRLVKRVQEESSVAVSMTARLESVFKVTAFERYMYQDEDLKRWIISDTVYGNVRSRTKNIAYVWDTSMHPCMISTPWSVWHESSGKVVPPQEEDSLTKSDSQVPFKSTDDADPEIALVQAGASKVDRLALQGALGFEVRGLFTARRGLISNFFQRNPGQLYKRPIYEAEAGRQYLYWLPSKAKEDKEKRMEEGMQNEMIENVSLDDEFFALPGSWVIAWDLGELPRGNKCLAWVEDTAVTPFQILEESRWMAIEQDGETDFRECPTMRLVIRSLSLDPHSRERSSPRAVTDESKPLLAITDFQEAYE